MRVCFIQILLAERWAALRNRGKGTATLQVWSVNKEHQHLLGILAERQINSQLPPPDLLSQTLT